MPDAPPAEIRVDEALVRRLLAAQAAHLGGGALPLRPAGEGWDCSVWRLGDELAVRMPRRAAAAALVQHEREALPAIAVRLRATGIGVPAPVFAGRPGDGYPFPWSVVPWFDGAVGARVPRADRAGWAAPLAAALQALHIPATSAPVNPYRGVPLRGKDEQVTGWLAAAETAGSSIDALARAWRAGCGAPPWSRAPVWIHGDLHPGNLIARSGELIALIDFGDVTAGDPAYDLAIAWLAFDAPARAIFRTALADAYDLPTWLRAKAWAAACAALLLTHSDDAPDYRALGRDALRALSGTSPTVRSENA